MSLVPIPRRTAAQAVTRQLLDLIRDGEWPPGAQLPTEKELMERLRVGRSTVREALQVLATLNVVQPVPGQGTFVKQPGIAEVLRPDVIGVLLSNPSALALLEAREMIEPTLIRLACLRGTEEDFERIEALLDEHEAALNAGQPVSGYAARFHVVLAEAAHSPVATTFMSSILELLTGRGRRFDGAAASYHRKELADHRALLEAVRARDPEHAADLLLRHIVESAMTYDREGAASGRPMLEGVNTTSAARRSRRGERQGVRRA